MCSGSPFILPCAQCPASEPDVAHVGILFAARVDHMANCEHCEWSVEVSRYKKNGEDRIEVFCPLQKCRKEDQRENEDEHREKAD